MTSVDIQIFKVTEKHRFVGFLGKTTHGRHLYIYNLENQTMSLRFLNSKELRISKELKISSSKELR